MYELMILSGLLYLGPILVVLPYLIAERRQIRWKITDFLMAIVPFWVWTEFYVDKSMSNMLELLYLGVFSAACLVFRVRMKQNASQVYLSVGLLIIASLVAYMSATLVPAWSE